MAPSPLLGLILMPTAQVGPDRWIPTQMCLWCECGSYLLRLFTERSFSLSDRYLVPILAIRKDKLSCLPCFTRFYSRRLHSRLNPLFVLYVTLPSVHSDAYVLWQIITRKTRYGSVSCTYLRPISISSARYSSRDEGTHASPLRITGLSAIDKLTKVVVSIGCVPVLRLGLLPTFFIRHTL